MIRFFCVAFVIVFATSACQREEQVSTTIPEGAVGYLDDEGQVQVLESTQFVVNQLSNKIGISEAGEIDTESISIGYNQETGVGYLYFKKDTESGRVSSAIRVRRSAGFMLPIAEEHTCAGDPCEDCNFTYKDDGSIEGCTCADKTAGGVPTGFCNHTVSSGGF